MRNPPSAEKINDWTKSLEVLYKQNMLPKNIQITKVNGIETERSKEVQLTMAMTRVRLGYELDEDTPLNTALKYIYTVNGELSIYGRFALGVIRKKSPQSLIKIKWIKEKISVKIINKKTNETKIEEREEPVALIEVKRNPDIDEWTPYRFSKSEAIRRNLWNSSDNWIEDGENMLMWKCVDKMGKFEFPDITLGLNISGYNTGPIEGSNKILLLAPNEKPPFLEKKEVPQLAEPKKKKEKKILKKFKKIKEIKKVIVVPVEQKLDPIEDFEKLPKEEEIKVVSNSEKELLEIIDEVKEEEKDDEPLSDFSFTEVNEKPKEEPKKEKIIPKKESKWKDEYLKAENKDILIEIIQGKDEYCSTKNIRKTNEDVAYQLLNMVISTIMLNLHEDMDKFTEMFSENKKDKPRHDTIVGVLFGTVDDFGNKKLRELVHQSFKLKMINMVKIILEPVEMILEKGASMSLEDFIKEFNEKRGWNKKQFEKWHVWAIRFLETRGIVNIDGEYITRV